MHQKREIPLMISGAALLLLLIIMFYALFQQERIYRSTMVFINENYRNDEGRIYKSKVPYEKFSSDKMFRWDAAHYRRIKESGYKFSSEEGGDFIFAFFPLFPLAWRLSGLTAVQISLINYLLWITSLIMLTRLLMNKETKYKWRYVLVLAGVPACSFYDPLFRRSFHVLYDHGNLGFVQEQLCFLFYRRPAGIHDTVFNYGFRTRFALY